MFGRRKDKDEASEPEVDGAVDGAVAGAEQEQALSPRPEGPWDETEDHPQGEHVDLAGLQIPVREGVEVRVEVDQEGQVIAATLTDGQSSLQLGAYAAPRTYGIWDDVRAEIITSLESGGGRSNLVEGAFGIELVALVPAAGPDGEPALQPARFVGVDGPRWFLRGLWTGPAVQGGDAVAPLLASAFRGVVVVRGKEPMPQRGPLPLKLPKEITDQAQAAQMAAAGEHVHEAPDHVHVAPTVLEPAPDTREV